MSQNTLDSAPGPAGSGPAVPDNVKLTGTLRPKRRPASLVVSIAILAIAIVCVILHPLLNSAAMVQNTALGSVGPGVWGHVLGTDQLGRDVLALLGAGALTAVVGPVVVALGSMLIGLLLGGTAGYRGGVVDVIAGRYADLLLALPAILLAVVVAGLLGGGYWVTVLVLIVLSSPSDVRLIRGAVMDQMTRPYIESARVLHVSGPRVLFRHVLPNVLPVAVANAMLNVAFALVAISSLSFLGIGVQPGTADWGLQLSDGRALLGTNPLAAIAPGVAIVAVATAANLLGNWASERMESR